MTCSLSVPWTHLITKWVCSWFSIWRLQEVGLQMTLFSLLYRSCYCYKCCSNFWVKLLSQVGCPPNQSQARSVWLASRWFSCICCSNELLWLLWAHVISFWWMQLPLSQEGDLGLSAGGESTLWVLLGVAWPPGLCRLVSGSGLASSVPHPACRLLELCPSVCRAALELSSSRDLRNHAARFVPCSTCQRLFEMGLPSWWSWLAVGSWSTGWVPQLSSPARLPQTQPWRLTPECCQRR